MHQKRDRLVVLYRHRSSQDLLLFPYVYYMGGEAAACGDAMEILAPAEPSVVGRAIVRLLSVCRKADIEGLKAARLEQLRGRWRGEPTTKERSRGEVWNQLLKKHPAMAKGPGSYLRQFSVCQVFERDGWNHRKLVRVEASKHRGCTTDGELQRLPLALSARQMGMQCLAFLAASGTN